MADDFIYMDIATWQRQLSLLEIKLSEVDREMRTNIMDGTLQGAAQILHNEQKRILSSGPTEGIRSMTSDLSVWKDERRARLNYLAYRVGYKDGHENMKHFVIEFGRPGLKGLKHGGRDKLGRKIGVIQPYPHIRAAWFLKRTEVNKYITQRIDSELQRRWNRNG